jgi:transcriptional regulator with XRE-family HTH domain
MYSRVIRQGGILEMYTLSEVKYQIGLNLYNLRKAKYWTQSTLAEKAQLSSKYISRLENGEENVCLDTLVKLSNVFEIQLSTLLTFDDE